MSAAATLSVVPGSARSQHRFSLLRGMRVVWVDSGAVLGTCRNLVATASEDGVAARLLVVSDPQERGTWLLPCDDVVRIEARRILVTSPRTAHVRDAAAEGPLRIGRDLVGRAVIDRGGDRVGVVRDVVFTLESARLRLYALELSLAATIAHRVRLPALAKGRLLPFDLVVPASLWPTRSALRLRVLRGEV